jgi:predicted  nucleic acid-binding Zn-ribbon protein
MEHNNDKQRKRYENAQINLSHLDRSVSRGRFDKDALKKSIDDLRDILKNNTLQASARDALQRDLEDLQIMRERH